VLRAIHAREDAVDKLRACCNKINAAVGGGATGGMLLPSDPLGRLFYRCGLELIVFCSGEPSAMGCKENICICYGRVC
jgi:hypothetical protein